MIWIVRPICALSSRVTVGQFANLAATARGKSSAWLWGGWVLYRTGVEHVRIRP